MLFAQIITICTAIGDIALVFAIFGIGRHYIPTYTPENILYGKCQRKLKICEGVASNIDMYATMNVK